MADAELGEVSGEIRRVVEGEAGVQLDAVSGARFDHAKAQRNSELGDFQPDHGERRKGERQGKIETVMSGVLRYDGAGVADIAAAVNAGIGIENFAINSGRRHADAISITHHRRKIAYADDPAAGPGGDAHERDD